VSRDGLSAAGSHPQTFEDPPGYPGGWPRAPTAPFGDAVTRCLPPRQIRRCRRRFRTTTIGRTRTPSIGLDPSLAARAGSTSLVVHARSLTPHPVARREPRHRPGPKPRPAALPASSKAGGVASSYLVASRGPPCRCRHFRPRDAARKMRLTDFCNRLPSRAPNGLSDSGRTLAPPRVLRRAAARVPAHPGRH